MRNALRGVWLAVCLFAFGVVGQTEEASAPAAFIRLYNTADASDGELHAARAEADRILRQAGIQVAWRDCSRTPLPPFHACAALLAPMEFLVRIVRGPAPATSPHATLGFSYIDASTGSGSLATAYLDRINATAERVGLHAGIILGRVIAHELGHLLLGNTAHARSGVMRAEFSDAWLAERVDVRSWRFSDAESTLLRRALEARMGGDRTEVARNDTPLQSDVRR
jgi:hypothetical protein